MIKINNELKLGIQSWSFRGLKDSNNGIIRALSILDIDCLEITGRHVDFKNESEVDLVIELYKENEITLTSCGVCGFTGDEIENRYVFDFAKKAGIKAISADISEDALELCDRLCDEYGIKLAIHNHGAKHRYGSFQQLDSVFNKTTANIGLCLDLAWMMDAGHDPVEALSRYRNRIYGIHFKDFIINEEGEKEVILGEGNLDLRSCVEIIKNNTMILYASIEFEEDENDPVQAIKQCIKNMALIL